MNLPRWTIVGFTGHRQVGDGQRVTRAIEDALDRLAARHGPLAVVASAASGADTLFLEAARRRGLPALLILPFARERFREDFAPDEWERVRPLIESAARVEELPEGESPEESYLETGIRTVDTADVMIGVLDATRQPGGKGGTADVVAYARALARPLIIVHPETAQATDERLEALPAGHASAPLPADWLTAVDAQYHALEDEAAHKGPRTRYLTLYIILLHLVAAAISVMSLSLHWPDAVAKAASFVKLAALLAALVLALRHRRAHHGWLHTRLGAELCRSFLAVWHFPRRTDPLPRGRREGVEDLWRALTIAWHLDRDAEHPDLEGARDAYVAERVRDQIGYYSRGSRRPAGWYRGLKLVVNGATIAAIAFAAVTLVIADGHAKDWSKMLSIVLPLMNAAILSLVVGLDLGRRATRYAEMVRRLEEAERRLNTVRTWQSLGRIVSETESMLLEEVAEWQALARFASEH